MIEELSVSFLRVEVTLIDGSHLFIKERLTVLASAKSERVFLKRYEQWMEAVNGCETQIKAYELYSWLVKQLREGLEFVDAESGLLRSTEKREA